MTNKNKPYIKEKSSSRRLKSTIQKKDQFPMGIVILVGIIVTGFLLSNISNKLGLFWIIGICFGFVLQKSRFCFTSSMRDPYLTGGTSLTKAVLIALAITTIGFSAIKFGAYTNGLPIPGQSYIAPISFATVIGAFMFGIGMVIAAGCASGTLMRVGEGFLLQILTLFFFIIGSLWGSHDYRWWNVNFISQGKEIFLPNIFGWFGAVFIQLLLIATLYVLADKWENKNQNL